MSRIVFDLIASSLYLEDCSIASDDEVVTATMSTPLTPQSIINRVEIVSVPSTTAGEVITATPHSFFGTVSVPSTTAGESMIVLTPTGNTKDNKLLI